MSYRPAVVYKSSSKLATGTLRDTVSKEKQTKSLNKRFRRHAVRLIMKSFLSRHKLTLSGFSVERFIPTKD